MNLDCFLKRFSDILLNGQGDDIFNTLKVLTGGTTSARIGKLLNFAVSQMDEKECYVEVGVFTGSTLCAANYMTERECVGIDSYDEKNTNTMATIPASQLRDRCLYNINGLTHKTRLIEKDFRNVAKDEIPHPVAVSFIDGKHDYEDVTENLKWLEPLLSDHAVIVFDDVNYSGVTKAIKSWMVDHGDNYDLLAYVKPFYGDSLYTFSLADRFLNNGVCILRYHRNPMSDCFYSPLELKGEPSKC